MSVLTCEENAAFMEKLLNFSKPNHDGIVSLGFKFYKRGVKVA